MLGLAAGLAHADRVHLVEGAVIEGKVSRQGNKVVIELESGQLSLPASAVAKVEPSASLVERFEQLESEQATRGVSGLMVLADFCRDHDMRAREQAMLQKVIEAQPDHAEARARLGFVKNEAGGWHKREPEPRQGLARDEDGNWARDRIAERERQRREAKLAEQEQKKAELELEAQKVALERQKLELERERAAKEAELLAPYVVYGGVYVHRDPCSHDRCERVRHKRHPHPFPIPGVRDPRDMSWPIAGVKDPRSDL